MNYRLIIMGLSGLFFLLSSCSSEKDRNKEEQIPAEISVPAENDSLFNSVQKDSSTATYPHTVLLTGLPDHRLVTVYKIRRVEKKNTDHSFRSEYSYEEGNSEYGEHFMPGIDILYGYNLLNIAHYDLKLEKLNFLFNHSTLIKTLYYPSFIQDSLDKKPINRNYFMVSVYDDDTNKDSLINKKDLRRFYHFDASCSKKTQLIPSDYSAIRSEYDPQNDVMYLFARHDANKNGTQDSKEPIHIFWFSLQEPHPAKRLY